jgi:predicted kinase
MQTDEFNQRLATAYLQTLMHRGIPHKRVLLSFCGVPGSGKTTLAKKLTYDLRAQYLRHDDIRALIRQEGCDPAKMNVGLISSIVSEIIMAHDANKFIIVDAGQDRQWERFFQHAKQWNAKPIIIRLNVPEEIVRARLIEREGMEGGHVAQLGTFIDQFENCKKLVKADIELGPDYEYEAVKSQVVRLIS